MSNLSSVSKAQIARLEALLARVQSRGAEPRPAPHAGQSSQVSQHDDADDLESTQQLKVRSPRDSTRAETEIVVEVEVGESSTETVVAVPIEEVPGPASIPDANQSRERLVAASPVIDRSPSTPEVAVAPPTALVPERVPEPEPEPELMAQVEDVAVEQVEVEEEAPISSRRPVAPEHEEHLAEMAFGAAEPEPPRHTPPPESGRLPAAAAVDFDGDVTGVRAASRPPASIEMVPEATLADLAPSDAVANIVGQPKYVAPVTFIAALDASIAL